MFYEHIEKATIYNGVNSTALIVKVNKVAPYLSLINSAAALPDSLYNNNFANSSFLMYPHNLNKILTMPSLV